MYSGNGVRAALLCLQIEHIIFPSPRPVRPVCLEARVPVPPPGGRRWLASWLEAVSGTRLEADPLPKGRLDSATGIDGP